jgi:hypothetical protein
LHSLNLNQEEREHEISSPSCSFRNEVLIKLIRGFMAISLHLKQVLCTEKLLVFQVGRREALARLVSGEGMFTNKEDEK